MEGDADELPRLAPMRVLIADDEADIRLMLKIRLELEPEVHVVGEVGDGAEALEFIRKEPPDVVILDLFMPEVDGFQVLARWEAEFPGVGVVAYSGVAGDYVRQEMDRLGVPLVLKSGNVGPLLAALRLAVRRS